MAVGHELNIRCILEEGPVRNVELIASLGLHVD
ncbi:hypothetical protein AVEN_244272-1, partial [Araneus ventricosus]